MLFPNRENSGDKIGLSDIFVGKTVTNLRQLAADEVFEVRSANLIESSSGGVYEPPTPEQQQRADEEYAAWQAEQQAKKDAAREAVLRKGEDPAVSEYRSLLPAALLGLP